MLSRISIRSQNAAISVRTRNARLHCSPARLQLHTQGSSKAGFEIRTAPPALHIDQSESFASAGLKPPLRNAGEYAARAEQKGINVIGRIAREGLQCLRIERGGNPLRAIAETKGMKPQGTLRLSMVTPPDITVTPGQVQVSVDTGRLDLNWQPIENRSYYIPGDVAVSLAVSPSIEIMVEPGAELHFPVSRGVGMNFNAAI